MTNPPKKLLVAGDTHGNPNHMLYIFKVALEQECDAIFQVGDFGFWEHMEGGPEFLELCSEVGTDNDLPIYFIDGNHENHRFLRGNYGDQRTSEGFWIIRPGVYYVPRGTRWEWHGVKMMGFGGAISIDKNIRRKMETEGYTDQFKRFHPPTGRFTQWWPEEESTDADLATALSDGTPLDILFTHDKPRASDPQWGNRDIPFLWPVQDKIQTLVKTLTPKLLIHGHLHHRYSDDIRCGDDGLVTHVEGLNCDQTYEESWLPIQLA